MKIETHNLIKRYGEKTVVNDVNVEVEQGTIVGLLGPNGAGKTTTFYMIVGIIQPDEGDVTVGDISLVGLPIYKRHQFGIGYLPQEQSVFTKMTVWENLMSLLETRKDLTPEEEPPRRSLFWMNSISAVSAIQRAEHFQAVKDAAWKSRAL